MCCKKLLYAIIVCCCFHKILYLNAFNQMFVPVGSQNMASSGQKVSPVHMYGGGIWWGKK